MKRIHSNQTITNGFVTTPTSIRMRGNRMCVAHWLIVISKSLAPEENIVSRSLTIVFRFTFCHWHIRRTSHVRIRNSRISACCGTFLCCRCFAYIFFCVFDCLSWNEWMTLCVRLTHQIRLEMFGVGIFYAKLEVDRHPIEIHNNNKWTNKKKCLLAHCEWISSRTYWSDRWISLAQTLFTHTSTASRIIQFLTHLNQVTESKHSELMREAETYTDCVSHFPIIKFSNFIFSGTKNRKCLGQPTE